VSIARTSATGSRGNAGGGEGLEEPEAGSRGCVAPPIGRPEVSIPGVRINLDPRGRRAIRALRLALAVALALAGAAAAQDLRVGTSGDYPPFSVEAPASPDGLAGLDVELLRAWAKDRGVKLRFVRFRWPELPSRLRAGDFEIAVGGVTVRPERSVWGAFTRPLVETGAVALVRDPARFGDLPALASARIAVNAGGHLERVAAALFPAAQRIASADNGAPPRLLAAGEVDAALTDSAEAPLWLRQVPGAAVVGPFTRDVKAWWVRAERADLARDLDGWLAAREADGSLARARTAYLGSVAGPAAAAPLPALLAAIRERLELQPLVAEAKRGGAAAVSVPAQEERVLEAAVAAVHAAALRQGRPAPSEDAVRALFRAQIEAGKTLQAATLARPPAGGPAFDLAGELRPALARVSEGIADLLVELPPDTPAPEIRRCAEEALGLPDLDAPQRRALGDALARFGAAPRGEAQRSRESCQASASRRTSL
jgi:cyclohexadienyl dehydratase